MRTPSPPECGLDLAPPLADRFIMEMAPLDYGPVLLRKPFGFRLAADTLPSGCPCGHPADEALPPSLDTPPLIRAAEGLEPSGSKRCPAHTTNPSATPGGPAWPSRAS